MLPCNALLATGLAWLSLVSPFMNEHNDVCHVMPVSLSNLAIMLHQLQ